MQPPSAKEATTRQLIDLRQQLEQARESCTLLAIFRQRFRPPAAPAADADEFEEVPAASAKAGFEATYGDSAEDPDAEAARLRAKRLGKQRATDSDDDDVPARPGPPERQGPGPGPLERQGPGPASAPASTPSASSLNDPYAGTCAPLLPSSLLSSSPF